MKQVNCTIKGCRDFGRYCRVHSKLLTPEKESKPIAKVAEKREEVNKEYTKEARAFVKANPECMLKMEGCTKKSQCVHHRKGKDSIERLMDTKWWWGSCLHCNVLAEAKDALARSKNIKLSKFNESETNDAA
jgi:hypothetical protein